MSWLRLMPGTKRGSPSAAWQGCRGPFGVDHCAAQGRLDVLAVIETPRGSRNKYAFDLDLGAFRLKAVLPQGNVFPFDFGFIPSTKTNDGDPLDLLVLLEDSVPMGCAISVRLIGAIGRAEGEGRGLGPQRSPRRRRDARPCAHGHEVPEGPRFSSSR